MFGFHGIVLELSQKEIKKMKEEINIDNPTLTGWDKQEPEYVTSIVRELCKYLYPTPEVEILDPCTKGDQLFKVDVILHFPECEGEPARSIAFQCKSSKVGAEEHMAKYAKGVKVDGKVYPCPGVYYNSTKSMADLFTLEQVKALGDFVGAVIHPELLEAIDLLKKISKVAKHDGVYSYLEYDRFRSLLPATKWHALQRFKYVSIGGGRIILNV
jgi:hypothetical protein